MGGIEPKSCKITKQLETMCKSQAPAGHTATRIGLWVVWRSPIGNLNLSYHFPN